MYTFLTVLHVFVCIFLMLVVLLQAGRGGGIGLAFGGSGGSQSVFGSSGGANFLTRLTAVCAIVFRNGVEKHTIRDLLAAGVRLSSLSAWACCLLRRHFFAGRYERRYA